MKPDLAVFLENYNLSGPRAYILAALGMAVATGLRIAMSPMLGDSSPFAIHALVLLVVTSLGGAGPGLFGLALALAFGWTSIAPYDQPMGQKIANEITTAVAGSMICLVTATMRTSILKGARARREADFLSLEMHHRVKNLFAVIASMATLSARERPEAKDALTDLRARVQALANAHDVAINPADFISFPDLVKRLMAPHVEYGPGESRVQLAGPPVSLPADCTTPLGLIINELSTNAVKYGSLATRIGTVRISWARQDDMLDICWEESCAEPTGARPDQGTPGFGSLLVEASVAQLRGTIDRNLTDDGLVVRLSIPCPDQAQKRFRSRAAEATQGSCNPPQSSLSALRGSKRIFRRRPQIRDSRS